MGRIGNMIIKDFLRQMCVPLENSAYSSDGDGFNLNPEHVLRPLGKLIFCLYSIANSTGVKRSPTGSKGCWTLWKQCGPQSGMYRYAGNWCIKPKVVQCGTGFTVNRVPMYNPRYNHNKTKHNTTLCIFHGINCNTHIDVSNYLLYTRHGNGCARI